MQLYKFTDRHYMTRDNTWWGEGVTHKLPRCYDPNMCSNQVIHAFEDINVAFLTKDIYFPKGEVIWLCEGNIVSYDEIKVGCFELTTLEQLMPPDWYYWEKNKKKNLVQNIYHREINKYFETLGSEKIGYNSYFLAKEIYDTYNTIYNKNGLNWCKEYSTLAGYIIFKWKSWGDRVNLSLPIKIYIDDFILDILRMIKFDLSNLTYVRGLPSIKESFYEVYNEMVK